MQIFIPVAGDRLFALCGSSLQLLSQPPNEDEACDRCWAWRMLADPPFQCDDVTSYVVHPDGRIFASIAGLVAPYATFRFSFAENTDETSPSSGVWELCGDWELPLAGRAHYDAGRTFFLF